MPRRNLLILLGTLVLSCLCASRADSNRYGRYFGYALRLVEDNYVEPVDARALYEGAMDGMVTQLGDQYSAYLDPDESTHMRQMLNQHFGGIGIQVMQEPKTGKLIVASPVVGTPAYSAGIRAGDTIVTIDGVATAGQTLEQAMKKLRGLPGEHVVLGILHETETTPKDYDLRRAEIEVESVLGDVRRRNGAWSFLLSGQPEIGYIRINTFGEKTTGELQAAVQDALDAGAKALVLDLRDNPGGLLTTAETICELFLRRGDVIVSTRGRGGRTLTEAKVAADGPFLTVPLAVLINRFSASASEIVAACLQDHGRASVFGERSWGKGTVQQLIHLATDGSQMRLTTASYWRPSGKNIHRTQNSTDADAWGVKPDPGRAVAMTKEQTEEWAKYVRNRDVVQTPGAEFLQPPPRNLALDPVLAAAVKALTAQERDSLKQPVKAQQDAVKPD